MKKFLLVVLVGLTTACAEFTAPTSPAEDYSLVFFGEQGTALENTMGAQPQSHPVDGRTGNRPLPDSLRLTQIQILRIKAIRDSFKVAHAEELDSLHSIFTRAREARRGGATREEIHTILITARPIANSLRDDIFQLHQAIRAVYTPSQRAWLEVHRRRPPITCMACGGICPGSGC